MTPDKLSMPKNRDRRGSALPMAISIAIHVIVIGALIQATRADRAMQGAVRDIPRNTTVIAIRDSAHIAGIAPEPSARYLFLTCIYQLDSIGVAHLVEGPARKGWRLGCKKTLPLSPGLWWQGHVDARYDADGVLEEIDGKLPRPDDPLVKMVQAWDLATPRPERQWPGLPTFSISVDMAPDSTRK